MLSYSLDNILVYNQDKQKVVMEDLKSKIDYSLKYIPAKEQVELIEKSKNAFRCNNENQIRKCYQHIMHGENEGYLEFKWNLKSKDKNI